VSPHNGGSKLQLVSSANVNPLTPTVAIWIQL